jgi:hypothetical protein
MKQISGYQELANAIIVQACEDYRILSSKDLVFSKSLYDPRCSKKEIEQFFKSQWFMILTDLDPQVILKKLKEENNYVKNSVK